MLVFLLAAMELEPHCDIPAELGDVAASLGEGSDARRQLSAFLLQHGHCDLADGNSPEPGAAQVPAASGLRQQASTPTEPESDESRRRISFEVGGVARSGRRNTNEAFLQFNRMLEAPAWRREFQARVDLVNDEDRFDRSRARLLHRNTRRLEQSPLDPYFSFWGDYDSRSDNELRGFLSVGAERHWHGERMEGLLAAGPGVLISYDDDLTTTETGLAGELRMRNRWQFTELASLENSVDFITDTTLELTSDASVLYKLSDPWVLRLSVVFERDFGVANTETDWTSRISLRYRLRDR